MADAPNWDDLEPLSAGDPSQQPSTPNWDDLEPLVPQSQRTRNYPDPQQGGSWDVTEHPEQRHDDITFKPDEPSTAGSAVRGVLRSAIPTTAGVIGAIGGGALGSAAGPVGTVGGALAGGIAAGGAARKLQDSITDTLGLDSPESRERDIQAHPYVSTAAELAPAALTLQPGNLSTSLATRLASGAALGGIDVVNQAVTKGSVDPTQTAIAAGAGAALPGVRPWAEGAAGAALRSVGASRAAARLGAPEAPAAAADNQIVRVDSPAGDPAVQAALKKPGFNPAPGPDARQGPSDVEAANAAFLRQGQRLNQDFPVRQPGEPANPRELYAPGEEPAAANENQPWNINQTSRETRAPDLGGAGDPAMMQRYGQRTRLAIPDRLQQWRQQNPAEFPPLPGVTAREQMPPEQPNIPAREIPAENAPAAAENLPSGHVENQKIPGPEAVGQNENELDVRNQPWLRALRPETEQTVYTPTPEGELHSMGAAAAPKGEILKAKSQIGDALKNTWGSINKGWRMVMTPEHLTEETGNLENIIREKTSMSDRNRIIHTHAQEDLEKAINQTVSPSQRNDFATGIWTGQIHPDNPLQRLADPAHKAIQDSLVRLQDVDPEGDWQKNFLPQMFADKDRARELIQDWEDQGRKGIPNPGDFMRNGVQLRNDVLRADGSIDPIQMMQRWHTGIDNFVRTKQTINEALKDGGPFSTEEFPDSVKLNSITKNGAPIYATPEVAMMADRYFTGPNSLDPTSRNFWDAAQKVKNFSTMWQLGMGAYHAVAETTEAYVGEMMRAIANPGRAGEILSKAPAAPYRQATKTFQEAMERYMDQNGMDNGTPIGKAVHYLVKTGLTPERISRYTPDVDSAARNAIEAWQKGALQMELSEKGARIGKAFGEGNLKGVGQTAGEGVRALGEAMQTTMHPLFNVYIPRLKVGAAVEQMLDYAAANPNATEAQLLKAAKNINKSVDDRLGELNQNYLFWNNFLKRFANLAMISPGWETGTLRAFFGGTKSLVESRGKALFTKNPEYTPNAAYPLAFAAVTALVGMTYQFLKTGKPPEDVRDPFFPKTGGKVARTNEPERAILPGYQKDVYSWWHLLSGHEGMTKNAASMLYNKLSLVPRSVWDTMANKDWSGHQIYNPDDPMQKKFADYMGYVHRNAMPIAYQTQRVRDPESNITRGEAELGIRHAPASVQKPVEEAEGIRKQNAKEQEKTRRFYNRLEGGPQPTKPKKKFQSQQPQQ